MDGWAGVGACDVIVWVVVCFSYLLVLLMGFSRCFCCCGSGDGGRGGGVVSEAVVVASHFTGSAVSTYDFSRGRRGPAGGNQGK